MLRRKGKEPPGSEIKHESVFDDLDSTRTSMQMEAHIHAGLPAPNDESHGPRNEFRGMPAPLVSMHVLRDPLISMVFKSNKTN